MATSSQGGSSGSALPNHGEFLEGMPTHMLIQELTRRHRILGAPTKRTVIVGPPSSGKSSVAEHFRHNFGYCSPLGALDSPHMTAEDKLQRIQERLAQPQCRKGFVVDGFPANTVQAEMLSKTLAAENQEIDRCVVLDATDIASLHFPDQAQMTQKSAHQGMSEGELKAAREDAARVSQWFEAKGVPCVKIDCGLPKDEVNRLAAEGVMAAAAGA
ncbi:unnamed protein product [Amoebophrya sp. A25]|nr:unnamed protein product [Amoebophrya sp. A25]|eukprot:GSA25T00017459001.1